MQGKIIRAALIGFLATTSIALIVTPALAQDAPQDTSDAAKSGGGDGNDIIVSARRRDETLQTTPVAITAINAAPRCRVRRID